MNDTRNKIDCSKCHNANCALAGKEFNMALCSGYKPLTHYDEIRSMNVEQLAEWIDENSCNAMWCCPKAHVEPDTGMCAIYDSIYDCKACIVKWLESEVKNGTSDKMGRKN